MKQYRCPHGGLIKGTSDVVYCVAGLSGFLSDGSPQWTGDTDVDWDSQLTEQRDGKDVYVCEDGESHTLDECTAFDDEIEHLPGDNT